MATGAVLSDDWARAAQSQAGLQTSGVDAELQQVCFTSSWVLSIASATSPVHLSPGDIDEVLFHGADADVAEADPRGQGDLVRAHGRAPQGTAQRPQRCTS
jgi:predicted metalloprotease